MKFLVLSQVYWPDTVSVAQHLGDCCEELSKKGHQVTVYTSRYDYEDKSKQYQKTEKVENILIHRLDHTHFGKSSLLGRVLDFLSFNIIVFLKLLTIKRNDYDAILGLTTPPLLPFFGIIISKIKKIPFYYWAMDLQPELSVASGLLNKNAFSAKCLDFVSKMTFRNSSKIIALDKEMASYIQEKGGKPESISIIPVWPVMNQQYTGTREENPFRVKHGFGDKIVIMYSGNHAFVHPLDTLLECAKKLRDDDRFLFVFIGGGIQRNKVTYYREKIGCSNIVQLPFQPKDYIHISLASADFQVVVMSEKTVGYTHPNKIYGAMFIGRPIIYIGPDKSFIGDILKSCKENISVEHNEVELLKQLLIEKADQKETLDRIGKQNQEYASKHFDPTILKEKMISCLTET